MNDKFLQRLNRLESELASLKEDYIRENTPSPEPSEPLPVPPVINPDEPIPLKKTVPPVVNPDEPIPLKKTVPVEPIPVPPEPRDDLVYPKTIHIKAPPIKDLEDHGAVPPIDSEAKEPEFEFPDSESGAGRFRYILEMFIGARLIGTLGIVLLLSAICYGVVYAYQHYNPPPELRVAGSCLASLAICGLGFWLRDRQFRFLALLLRGGGLGGLYISIWTGYHFYGLFGPMVAGLLMMSVAGLIFVLSWWENSQIIGIFATTGAFLMPLLVRTPNPNHLFFCLYLLCVNLPVIFLGLKCKWQVLYNLGFIFSALLGTSWSCRYIDLQSPVIVLLWIGLALEYITLNLLKLKRGHECFADYVRLVVLTLVLIGIWNLDGMRIEPLRLYLGSMVLYAVAAGIGCWLKREARGNVVLLTGGAAAFLALAIPEIFSNGRYIYLAWSCESLALAILGAWLRSRSLNRCAGAMALVTLAGIWYHTRGADAVFARNLYLNSYFLIATLALGFIRLQSLIATKRMPESRGSRLVMVGGALGMILIVGQNGGFYLNWGEGWLLFTGLAAATFGLVFSYLAWYVKEFNWLRNLAVAMFIILLIYAVFPGNGPGNYPWLMVLWPLGGLLWYWVLPRGNKFRIFAALLCMIEIGKCFMLQGTGAFFNVPFMAALVGGAVFLALNWIPPWQRPRGEENIAGLNPHLVSWGVIAVSLIFCWNFMTLDVIGREMCWLGIEYALLAIPVVLGVIAVASEDRRYIYYLAFVIIPLLFIVLVDTAWIGTGKPFFCGAKFYLWLLLPAVIWLVVQLCRKLFSNSEIIIFRLLSGTVFIYIIYRELSRLPNESYAKACSLIFLTAAAVLICAVGLWKRRPAARYYSFFLLAISISQLFVQSLFKLKDPARIIAFLALGILLLGLSWGYHKVSRYLDKNTRTDIDDQI